MRESQREQLVWLSVFTEKVVFELSRGLNMCSHSSRTRNIHKH